MKFRSMILVMTIAFSVIFVSMIGTSYAYYVVTDGTEINVTTSNLDTSVLIVFEESKYINLYTGIPVTSYTSVKSYDFTIKPDWESLTDYEAIINIGISDLYIDGSLRVSDFKYNLECQVDANVYCVASGDGTDFTDDVINSGYFKLGSIDLMSEVELGDTLNCSFYVWLEETGENQNHLMNKKFSGVMRFDTLYKK